MNTRPKVKIGELKAHLSEYLRVVRNGDTVTVYDRDEPIARIIPYEKSIEELAKGLVVIPAKRPLSDWDELAKGPPIDIPWEVVLADLMADRAKR